MELLLLFLIAAVGGVWWLNHVMNKKAQDEAKANLEKQEAEAPYKVDIIEEKVTVQPSVEQVTTQTAVQPTKCGCGRSPTGFCVGLHKLTAEEWAVHADNPKKTVAEKPVKRTRKPAVTKTSSATKTKSKKPSAAKPTVKKAKK